MIIKGKEGQQTFAFTASSEKKIEVEEASTPSPVVVEAEQPRIKEEESSSTSVTTPPTRDDSGTAAACVLTNWYLKGNREIKGKVHGHPGWDDGKYIRFNLNTSVNERN